MPISVSSGANGEVLRYNADDAGQGLATGDLGMDLATGRPFSAVGESARPLAFQSESLSSIRYIEDFAVGSALVHYPEWNPNNWAIVADVARGIIRTQAPASGILATRSRSVDRSINPIFEAVMAPQSPDGISPDVRMRMGFGNLDNFAAFERCHFMFDTVVNPNTWLMVGGTGPTVVVPPIQTVPVLDTFQRLRIELHTDGSADFFVNGTLIGSLSIGTVSLSPMFTSFFYEYLAGPNSIWDLDRVLLGWDD